MPSGRGEEVVIVSVGGGGVETSKLETLEEPPPGLGFLTKTLTVCADAISLAEIEAVSLVALMKFVARSDPFHSTVEVDTKLEPFTVRVKPGPPAAVDFGLS